MNVPLPSPSEKVADGDAAATLGLFALFHLNLAFSSIAEDRRGDVISNCYWPLLRLARDHGPIGVELTGYTLEEIAARDPAWIAEAKALIGAGRIELIGSGYAQIIGPLVPARVSEANLRIGNEIYERLLGVRPQLALVNEQAYSAGLVGLYCDAGYRAILMDWDNPAVHHPEWPAETRYLPQRALGADGRSIALLWTSTVAFQKLQRLAHGDLTAADYLSWLAARVGKTPRTLCLYASDAEVFGFRPGRYRTEEENGGGKEWETLGAAFAAIKADTAYAWSAPSGALALNGAPHAEQSLRLESATCPVPVKKQRKYNLSRWAVTGRDDIAINAACERIYHGLVAQNTPDTAWKELCYLWSSDFRTHITDARWQAFCGRLARCDHHYGRQPIPLSDPPASAKPCEGRYLEIETPMLAATLDRRRGMAIHTLRFRGHKAPILGGLSHGHFDDIALQADWYTGDCVFEAPGEPKITDLEWCDAKLWSDNNGDRLIAATIPTPNGPIEKRLRFHARNPRVDFDITFHWADWGRGSLRLGHFTVLPKHVDWDALSLVTHNGGRESETYALAGQTVDHGAPVSFLVSASYGFGMTEGWAELGDRENRIRIEVNRQTAPLLGLLHHRAAGGSLFCQLQLSALELDETRKPSPYRDGPRRFRFSVNAALP
jgi:hypothetical protein